VFLALEGGTLAFRYKRRDLRGPEVIWEVLRSSERVRKVLGRVREVVWRVRRSFGGFEGGPEDFLERAKGPILICSHFGKKTMGILKARVSKRGVFSSRRGYPCL